MSKKQLTLTERRDIERSLPKSKKRQSTLSRAAGIGGLTAAGGLATAAIIRRPGMANPKNLSKIPRAIRAHKQEGFKRLRAPDLSTPEKRAKVADSIKDKSFILGSSAAAVGGLGSLNFASVQGKEAKLGASKKKP